ncbi:MAG: NADH-quinone oxidoreductase subunit NuoE [Henriciella sp.]|jgi:NADH-quinone oxidoreductase subunit E|uniref:NADH-quinone oxidoreductase subunit NuoE n=1 Tax=Henriciella sp. TaxID=1968823 RepID=UPI000C117DBE|nr:NADH-quinone oxidoreductase subunit NuoE [Henriciella sp.]MAN73321.1 NADH-quinone oxidoreductase subunit NuoE [Henriciella sp.]MBF33399.1 NADH-quinone oxidoreductase subunit NuoE [Hyphomonadaceae bacterium]PHR82169.1 MAG: NADH-quinone oxidoreductase subunit NuoE [Henriciella sp.]|tara:strand:- start:1898 stop:2923 length:1026 start_codon:yes stop_codon:yes gene_type:complete
MALRRFDLEAGGETFAFNAETEPTIEFWLGKYPADKKRSAVIPLLWLAQKDNGGWLSEPAMRTVADRLEMPYIRVYEVATFYTMFRLQPVGKNHVQLCGTTPCMLRGANDLKKVCEKRIGKKMAVTDDGRLSWEEVECLGACVNAPMVQINDYYYEDLTPETLDEILSKLAGGVAVEPGNFVDRLNSAPEGGATTLKEGGLYDGSRNGVAGLPNLPEATNGDKPEAEAKGEPARSKPTNVDREETSKAAVEKADDELELEGERPEAADIDAEESDDLKKIKGIGPKIETQLNELGVHRFAQIAAWSDDNVKWVDGYLSFRGRIQREEWISQAKTLASEDKS